MNTKYYRQDGKVVRCTDLKTFNNTEDFLLDEVRILEKDQANLKRQLAEAREFAKDATIQLDYYSVCGGTQATEFLSRNKEFINKLKEKGDE